MRTLSGWCFRHRRIVVSGWIVLVAGLLVASSVARPSYDNALSLPGTDSARAMHLLTATAPERSGDTELVVLAARGSVTLDEPTLRREAAGLFARLATLPGVTGITSPFAPDGAAQINAGRTIAFAGVHFAKSGETYSVADGRALVAAARASRSPDLDVAVEGVIADLGVSADLGGVGIGIIGALLVLLVVFGSFLAATLPLVSTLAALPAAISVVGLLTHAVAIPDFAGQLVMLIGLGVGVDYALFIVTRTRQGLQAGLDVEEAITTAVATSGRAVLFAGGVVCIALLGLVAVGLGLLTGLGIASSIGVLFTMAASLTLLPALLGFLGPRVLSRRQRRALEHGEVLAERGVWWWWSALVARRPAVPAALAVLVVSVLSVPVLSMRVGVADDGNALPGSTTREAYDLLARGFGPGFNGPLVVAVRVGTASGEAPVSALRRGLMGDAGVAAVTLPQQLATVGDTRVVSLTVYPATAPQDVATTGLVHRLRDEVIPHALRGTGARAFLGGGAAVSTDLSDVLTAKMPLFVGLVVLLSFLLLTLLFRSILIPLTAAVMNVLSTGAALGVLAGAYVWGWGGDLLGAGRAGPVEAPLPVMVFAILFGLSMDYQVFLACRIQEEWHRTGDNRLAVQRGLALTGRTITAAALIMIVVFGSFVLGSERLIKMFGLGLATAVFVDAFLVRVAVVPAVMFLLGRGNWWLPRRLDRLLPKVALEVATR